MSRLIFRKTLSVYHHFTPVSNIDPIVDLKTTINSLRQEQLFLKSKIEKQNEEIEILSDEIRDLKTMMEDSKWHI